MELMTAICMASAMFSVITAIFSILAYAKVVGMEKSTHRIQYVPAPSDPYQYTGSEEGEGLSGPELAQKFSDLEGDRNDLY